MPESRNTAQKYQENLLKLCFDVVKGDLAPEEAVKQFLDLQGKKHETGSLLSDVLQAVDVEVECSDDEEKKTRFRELCKLCSQLVPGDVVHLALDSQIDDVSSSKIIKTKTRLFYKQLKFNLLREESEGYSKIISELSQDTGSDFNAKIALTRVRCLIGQFNLDPNRVLDLILECFECRLGQHRFFVELLNLYGASKDDLCNLLGFKFTFYQAKFKSQGDVPSSLYILAALLIHYRLIDLVPLGKFLSPTTDWILEHHKKLLEEAVQKAKKMQIHSTATLEQNKENSGDQGSSTQVGDAAELGEPGLVETDERYSIGENQKLGLTWALLEIGDWPLAKQLLDRMPEFYGVRCIDIARSMIRLTERRINGLYLTKCPEYCCLLDRISTDDSKLSRKVPDSQDMSNKNEEVSFCDNEATVPRVDSYKDLAEEVFPMLHYLGPGIAHGPLAMTRLVRILAAYVRERNGSGAKIEGQTDDSAEANQIFCKIVDLVDEVLLPGLTILSQNCTMSEELWTVIGTLPYQTRYRLYGRWKNTHTGKHPLLAMKRGQVFGRTRYVMKRLSKETTRLIGRQLGKLSHTHPAIVFDYMLNQIQTFENLIGPVVESLRYLTNMEFDILAYCIIEHLASPAKEKLKVSDATLSPWLQSLATFVGTVFKKYNMELTGVLQYVANQLKAGKSFDLLVLREVIQNMSGIETTSGLTTEQVEALAGGDLLRQEGGYFGQIRNIRRTTNRLKEALLQEDLVVGLCILMAQQRGSIVFEEGKGIHLKLVGQMLDQCQDTLVQFASFLSTNLKAEDYAKRMPAAPQLIQDYHVPHDAAMLLTRPIYINAIATKYDELKKQDRANKISLNGERKSQHYKTAINQVLDPLADALKPLFPAPIWEDISPKLFVTFWTLTMYDVHVPKSAYERESDRLKKSIQLMEESRDLSESKRRKEKDRLTQTESKLMEEQRRQQDHVNRVMNRLKMEKEEWFYAKAMRSAAVNQFMQLCLLPRCVYTDQDALFCAKFINVVHSMKTVCFNTLICYDRIFNEISPSLAGLSENEASYFGRFLCAMMESMMRWHSDSAAFAKECSGFPGFITKFRNPVNAVSTEEKDNTRDKVDFENFRHVVHKWHFKLTKSLLASLGSGNYVMIRNALIIMIKILPYFPVLKQFHKVIESKVVKIRDDEKEKRQDLSVLAASYWGHLKVRKTPLMNEEDFHQKAAPKAKPAQQKLKSAAQPAKAQVSTADQKIAVNGPDHSKSAAATIKEGTKEGAVSGKVVKTVKTGVSSKSSPAVTNSVKTDEASEEKTPAPKPHKVYIHRTSLTNASENSVATSESPKITSSGTAGKEPAKSSSGSTKQTSKDSTEMKPPARPGTAVNAGGSESRKSTSERKATEEASGRKSGATPERSQTGSPSERKKSSAMNGDVGKKTKEEKTERKAISSPQKAEGSGPKRRKVEEMADSGRKERSEEKKGKKQMSRSSPKEHGETRRSRSREVSTKKEAGSVERESPSHHHHHKGSHHSPNTGPTTEKRKREEAKADAGDHSKSDGASNPKKVKIKGSEAPKEKSSAKRSRKTD